MNHQTTVSRPRVAARQIAAENNGFQVFFAQGLAPTAGLLPSSFFIGCY